MTHNVEMMNTEETNPNLAVQTLLQILKLFFLIAVIDGLA